MKWLRDRKKRKKHQITVMLVPGTVKRPWQVTLSDRKLKMIVGTFAAIIALALLSSYMAFSDRAEIERINSIKQESRDKDRTIQKLQKQMQEIESQQQAVEKRQTQIQKMMGIKGNSNTMVTPSRGSIREDAGLGALKEGKLLQSRLALDNKTLDDYIDTVKKNEKYYRSRPNQWPCQGEISSLYGWRKSPFRGRSKSFHDGLDIAGEVGTSILAAGDGTVIFSGWKPVYGKTIEIDHGNGLVTKYGHNSRLLVKKGDKIKKGQQIAAMGTTGRSTGPHLHFSIIKGGATLDPEKYLP
ncbi:MAG TPA: M23 family metallopeptidase [Syntrophomonadaceae bacterium]|nr:M23 family metallopeptidase [Syntrophomonadaceae bacterium]